MERKVVQLASYKKGDAFVLVGEFVRGKLKHAWHIPSPSLIVPPEEFYPQKPTTSKFNPRNHSICCEEKDTTYPMFKSLFTAPTWKPNRSGRYADEDRLNGCGSVYDD